jgi:hypothetical protein
LGGEAGVLDPYRRWRLSMFVLSIVLALGAVGLLLWLWRYPP